MGMSVSGLGEVPFLLHQVFICETAVLSQLRQFWDTIQSKLADKGPYTVSIGDMRIKLPELQDDNKKAKKLRSKRLSEGKEDIEQVPYYQDLSYVPKVICLELISRHYDNPLASYFDIEKTQELIARKYYWPTLQRDVKDYVKGCNICLASKTVCHNPYGDLQSLPILTHWWKDLSMDFVTGLPISADWKSDSYDSILVIVDQLIKMVHYEPIKVTIDAPGLAEVIINVVMRYHGVLESIVIDQGLLFTLKF